jgi:hypothetical protein
LISQLHLQQSCAAARSGDFTSTVRSGMTITGLDGRDPAFTDPLDACISGFATACSGKGITLEEDFTSCISTVTAKP